MGDRPFDQRNFFINERRHESGISTAIVLNSAAASIERTNETSFANKHVFLRLLKEGVDLASAAAHSPEILNCMRTMR